MSSRRILTRAEGQRVLGIPKSETATGRRNRAILELLYRSGARTGEVIDLRTQDVRLEEGSVLLAAGHPTRERDLPLDAESQRVLRQYAAKRPAGDFFFATLQGGQLSPDYIRQLVSRCAEKAGLEAGEVSPRTLRDTYGAELQEDGFTPDEMQIALGLGSRASLDRYLHARTRSLREKVEARGAQRALPKATEAELLHLARLLRELPANVREELARALVREELRGDEA